MAEGVGPSFQYRHQLKGKGTLKERKEKGGIYGGESYQGDSLGDWGFRILCRINSTPA